MSLNDMPGWRGNFETLKRAALNDDLALMECRRKHVTLVLTDDEALYLENILAARIKKHECPPQPSDLFTETQRVRRLAAERSMIAKLNRGEKEIVAVVCAVNRVGGAYEFAPLAMLFNDDPYTLLDPPDPDNPGGFVNHET